MITEFRAMRMFWVFSKSETCSETNSAHVRGQIEVGRKLLLQYPLIQSLPELRQIARHPVLFQDVAEGAVLQPDTAQLLFQPGIDLAAGIHYRDRLLLLHGHHRQHDRHDKHQGHEHRSQDRADDKALGPDDLEVFPFDDSEDLTHGCLPPCR
jgi:hypothetical protein